MNVLFIVNGPAYGSELPFNGLRLASTLATRDGVRVRLFPDGRRGLEEEQLVEGAMRSSMEQLADWTLEADRIVTF